MEGTARDPVRRLTRDARISPPNVETKCSIAEASTCVNLANLTIRREEEALVLHLTWQRVLIFYLRLVVTARAPAQRLTRDARISPPREVTRSSIAEASTCVNPANRTIRREEDVTLGLNVLGHLW